LVVVVVVVVVGEVDFGGIEVLKLILGGFEVDLAIFLMSLRCETVLNDDVVFGAAADIVFGAVDCRC
jgi:hypothetical protein